MQNNSKSNIDVKATGSKQGADKMMKYDAIGSMWLKILGGVGLVLGGVALVITALGTTGVL